MSDLFFDKKPASNTVEFSVSEISAALKNTVEAAFSHVRIRGEISGYRGPHASGHAYFALKDDKARIEAVIWRGAMAKLKFQPEEGMEVIVTGKLTTYPGSSKYQIVIDLLEPAGIGALMALLEERKRKLGDEGLFDAANKQLLPFMPRIIGVVTSPTGAVIRDIIHRISDRFPLHIIVWPVRVQGETSGSEVALAIDGFNTLSGPMEALKPDLIIVARGGGSLEDLWGFNDEIVVRAAARSKIPVISAVGHETDWTLLDYAADLRAPTPTGAAELAVPVKGELEVRLAALGGRLKAALTRNLDFRRQRLIAYGRALPTHDALLAIPRRRFDEAASRLERALVMGVQQKRLRFQAAFLQLSPKLVIHLTANGHQALANLQQRTVLAWERRQQLARHRTVEFSHRLNRALITNIDNKRYQLSALQNLLSPNLIVRLSEAGRQKLQNLAQRRNLAWQRRFERWQQRLATVNRLLRGLSYQSVLERGFALVLDEKNQPIKRRAATTNAQPVTLRFVDGDTGARIEAADYHQPRLSDKKNINNDNQGSLF